MTKFTASRLKEARKTANMTQNEVANALGMSVRRVKSFEIGEQALTVDDLLEFANLYMVDVRALLLEEYVETSEEQLLCNRYIWIWDDERHGPESMNSDMILAITAEYMKKYPDALFQFEWSGDDNMFLDKTDIDNTVLQPFDPSWFGEVRSHLRSARVDKYGDEWTLG